MGGNNANITRQFLPWALVTDFPADGSRRSPTSPATVRCAYQYGLSVLSRTSSKLEARDELARRVRCHSLLSIGGFVPGFSSEPLGNDCVVALVEPHDVGLLTHWNNALRHTVEYRYQLCWLFTGAGFFGTTWMLALQLPRAGARCHSQ